MKHSNSFAPRDWSLTFGIKFWISLKRSLLNFSLYLLTVVAVALKPTSLPFMLMIFSIFFYADGSVTAVNQFAYADAVEGQRDLTN